MGAWTEDELRRIGETQELQIAPVRRNGDLRRSTPIWVVRVDDDLYVRAAYGSAAAGTGSRRRAAKRASRPAAWRAT